MPKELIEEGTELKVKEVKMVTGKVSQSYEGIEFETWASKVALFFERQNDTPVKARLLEKYSKLSKNSSKEFFDLAIGALQAVEE